MSVINLNPAFRLYRNRLIVGDQHDGVPLLMQLMKQLNNLHSGFGIQISCRFICKEQTRSGCNCTGNCHALLLTARKLIGEMRSSCKELDALQRLPDPIPPFLHAYSLINERELHVLFCTEIADQIIILKDKPDFLTAYTGKLFFGIGTDRQTVEQILAFIRSIQTPHDIQQSGFSAARRADNTDKFPFLSHGNTRQSYRIAFPLSE